MSFSIAIDCDPRDPFLLKQGEQSVILAFSYLFASSPLHIAALIVIVFLRAKSAINRMHGTGHK